MRKIFLFLVIVCSVSAAAQTQKEWKDSITWLNQLIEQHPKSLELRMRKAEANIALEQWQYALDEYTNILDLYPTHIGALYFRGYVNHKMHRNTFARADYEQVLRYEPDHKGALTGLIMANTDEKQLNTAYDQANHLIELYGQDAACYITRAQVEEAMDKFMLAAEDVTTAINLEGDKMSDNQSLSLNDTYTQYVLYRIELYRKQMNVIKKKKSDDELLDKIEADKAMLMARGIPSRAIKKK